MTEKSILSGFRKRAILLLVLLPTILGCYVLSICWRVGFAEVALFGRSYLPPSSISTSVREFLEPATAESCGNTTFTFMRGGKPVHVYKQLINSFQHVYGSALSAYELGSTGADALFRANEYAESIVCRNSGSEYFFLDTKKDLANNAIGRRIGLQARERGLGGPEADKFIVASILSEMDNKSVYNHFQEERVVQLPSFNDYGCPYLLDIQRWRSGNKLLTTR